MIINYKQKGNKMILHIILTSTIYEDNQYERFTSKYLQY